MVVVDAQSGVTLSQFATPSGVDYWNGGLPPDPATAELYWPGDVERDLRGGARWMDGSSSERDLGPQEDWDRGLACSTELANC